MSAYHTDRANSGEAEGPPPTSIGPIPSASPSFGDIGTAFQPIIDLERSFGVFAHEALVRGADGEGAADVFARVARYDRHTFEHVCRVRALEWAARLDLPGRLSLNISPSCMAGPRHGVRATLAAAAAIGIPPDRLIFELTEQEPVQDYRALRSLTASCRDAGALIALDDFGAGYAALTPLVEIRPDILKLDMGLVRSIDTDPVRGAVVGAVSQACRTLGITLVAEGVETSGETRALRAVGISLMQGYLFARPGFECLPVIQPVVEETSCASAEIETG